MFSPEKIEFGLNSFGEVATDKGRALSDAETIRLLIDEAQLAESVNLDMFSIGEHYREDYVDTAPPVLLAAAAQATSTIKLGTSVTVLSTQDPVRLYHQFSTVDAISNGRTQLVLGRASVIESFNLFGYELNDYDQLFEENLSLFLRLMKEEVVTWEGKHRPPLHEQTLRPRMQEGGIPAWIGIGGNPASVIRAARHGLPLMMAIIGGRAERFGRHVELYLKTLEELGHPELPIGQHSLGLIAETDEEAAQEYWEPWRYMVSDGYKAGVFYAPGREQYARELDTGALFVGSPETVARKIAHIIKANRLSRFDLKYDMLHLPRQSRERTITLFGEKVVPLVREMLAENE